jgi:hypothetical protein
VRGIAVIPGKREMPRRDGDSVVCSVMMIQINTPKLHGDTLFHVFNLMWVKGHNAGGPYSDTRLSGTNGSVVTSIAQGQGVAYNVLQRCVSDKDLVQEHC